MKNTKALLALLMLVPLLCMVGCDQPSNTKPSDNPQSEQPAPGTDPSQPDTVDAAVQQGFQAFVASLAQAAQAMELPANMVEQSLQASNQGLQAIGYRIVDSSPSSSIEQGTTVDTLKSRFTLEKVESGSDPEQPAPGPDPSQPGTVDAAVQQGFQVFVASLAQAAQAMELPANMVEQSLQASNQSLQAMGYRIVDSSPSSSIEQGTTVDTLKSRFTLEKL